MSNDAETRDREFENRRQALGNATDRNPGRLTILSESQMRLPTAGAEVTAYKVVDTDSGESWRLALDADGSPLDIDDLLERERAAARDRYGTLQEALHELLEQGGREDESVPVMLRYVVDEDPTDFDKLALDDGELDDKRFAELAEEASRREQQIERRAEALHREVLSTYEIDPDAAGPPRTSGPFVRARIPVRALRGLSRDERITFIGLDEEKVVLDYSTIPQSLPTTRVDTVQSSGFRGSGVKIAVLECGGLWKPAGCFNIGAIHISSLPPDDHITMSVGIIGNRYSSGGCSGSLQGYAPDASVLLANDSAYQDGYDWARGQGVNVVTMSWHYPSERRSGVLSSRDVYFDYWVAHFPYPSVFTSAGNGAAFNDFACGKGYNFFGVGDVLNDGDGDRCNDAMSSDSSRKNPTSPHSDHEVPAVAAPGSVHDLLGYSFGGTSCATPVTAAIAALLMSENSSLKVQPAAIRAILLASANYQRADGADYSNASGGADGAGTINAYYGMLIAGVRESGATPQLRAHDYGLMTAGDFSGGMFNKEYKAQASTTRSRIRVALAWNSNVTASSILDADLDLRVYDPDGILIAWSTTWDNSWELVELTPSKIGTYTIKVSSDSIPSNFSSRYGVAWMTHYDLC